VAHELKSAVDDFVRFAQALRGDEKSEAQTVLDHFFRALGHEGVIEAGATFEFRVAKKPGSPQLELIKGNGAQCKPCRGPRTSLLSVFAHRSRLDSYHAMGWRGHWLGKELMMFLSLVSSFVHKTRPS
jgi:hypothetical protein